MRELLLLYRSYLITGALAMGGATYIITLLAYPFRVIAGTLGLLVLASWLAALITFPRPMRFAMLRRMHMLPRMSTPPPPPSPPASSNAEEKKGAE